MLTNEFLTLDEVAEYTLLPLEVIKTLAKAGAGPKACKRYHYTDVQDWVWDNFRESARFNASSPLGESYLALAQAAAGPHSSAQTLCTSL